MQSYSRPSDSVRSASRRSSIESQRQQLERLIRRPPTAGHPLQTWGQALVRFLTAPAAPRIRQRQHQGHTLWYVYDPHTQLHHRFDQANEVRQWLEARYYN